MRTFTHIFFRTAVCETNPNLCFCYGTCTSESGPFLFTFQKIQVNLICDVHLFQGKRDVLGGGFNLINLLPQLGGRCEPILTYISIFCTPPSGVLNFFPVETRRLDLKQIQSHYDTVFIETWQVRPDETGQCRVYLGESWLKEVGSMDAWICFVDEIPTM